MTPLEQEPCEDCISREAALMALTGKWTESRDEIIPKAIRRIEGLPSCQCQPNGVLDKVEVDGKVLDCSKAKIKTHHPRTGEYVLSGFWEVEE